MNELDYTRTILRLTGKDVRSFLQGITTQDITQLDHHPLIFTAFLSPQGKLLFDGFLSIDGDSLLLDIATSQAELATSYITRYKLRADVKIEETGLHLQLGTGHPDPRHSAMPARGYIPSAECSGFDYHTQRLTLAIPESAYDSSGDDVAMDLGYDLLNAISFTKGCYVGQEVTARMHYKSIARRGIMRIEGDMLPEPNTPIMAGEIKLGEMRSHQGQQGIALIRYDSYETALANGTLITANNTPIIVTVPQWAEPKFSLYRQGKDGV